MIASRDEVGEQDCSGTPRGDAPAGSPLLRSDAAYTSIADLIDRVPEINKREIRALSLAGALNFDNTVHRRQALWESELAIQPEGELFEDRGQLILL